jgi:NAD(P)-dependent dehydrogenase (short-subunit alcohol dehydrogenase family)
MDSRFVGRIALVTGASRGIGRAVALALGAAGAHVIALARTSGALEELDDEIRAAGGEPATLVPVDLADMPALDRLGLSIHERWGRLDMLVGNAGLLGPLSPLGHIDPKVFDNVMAVNVTANWRLIRSLDPLLRQSTAGRAVFLSSTASQKSRPYWGLYATTKIALEMLVRTYAAETAHTAVKANLVNPGAMRTKMRAQAMPGEDPETLPPPEDVVPPVLDLLVADCTVSGLLYDHPSRVLKAFQPPAAVG